MPAPVTPTAARVRFAPLAAALTAGLLLLTACGSGDDPTVAGPSPSAPSSPTATPTASPAPAPTAAGTPTAPAAATPSAPSATSPSRGVLSAWKDCGDGFTCATLTVPLDDAKPAAGDVALALTRKRATGAKIGSLIVNPGGPGASAVGYLQAAWTNIPPAVRKRFDLVAFDPRGVGKTAPVRCLTTAQLDDYFHLDPVPDNATERTAISKGNRDLVNGCAQRSGKVLPHVSTKVVAQDLDRVRQAVGDAKLTYLGYSYGTAIGASYLEQLARLRAESTTNTTVRPAPINPAEAVAFIEGIAEAWRLATPEERARLVQATYERVTVKGPNGVQVKLTPMAERTGLPGLLPENVHDEWAVARPTGGGRAIATYTLPIEGRDEWLAAAARHLA